MTHCPSNLTGWGIPMSRTTMTIDRLRQSLLRHPDAGVLIPAFAIAFFFVLWVAAIVVREVILPIPPRLDPGVAPGPIDGRIIRVVYEFTGGGTWGFHF